MAMAPAAMRNSVDGSGTGLMGNVALTNSQRPSRKLILRTLTLAIPSPLKSASGCPRSVNALMLNVNGAERVAVVSMGGSNTLPFVWMITKAGLVCWPRPKVIPSVTSVPTTSLADENRFRPICVPGGHTGSIVPRQPPGKKPLSIAASS